jgi:NAD(P) transhydrogenase subunit alpha
MNQKTSLSLLLLFSFILSFTAIAKASPQETLRTDEGTPSKKQVVGDSLEEAANHSSNRWSRLQVLAGSLTVFVLAVFVGFEIIAKVPPTLHTPLMSGSNAISGITVVGAIIAAGQTGSWFGNVMALIGIVLAMINVVGGFYVTHRMLLMFKRK